MPSLLSMSYFDKHLVVYEHRCMGSTLTEYASDDPCNVLEKFDQKEQKLAGGVFSDELQNPK